MFFAKNVITGITHGALLHIVRAPHPFLQSVQPIL